MHTRNPHSKAYDLDDLIKFHPPLIEFVFTNKFDSQTINFFEPEAVKALNIALLKKFYGIKFWDFPDGYLCPPIPGRAEYIHQVSDLIKKDKNKSEKTHCLDIGVGANCIFPIIGIQAYDWNFVGVDVDKKALHSADIIRSSNACLSANLQLRHQTKTDGIFKGIIKPTEQFDLSICNPPFYTSQADAQKANLRKLSRLKKKKINTAKLNFGGQSNELWYKGGEKKFVELMILESSAYSDQVHWFTTLISKEDHLAKAKKILQKVKVAKQKIIPIELGNKKSRILAWSFRK